MDLSKIVEMLSSSVALLLSIVGVIVVVLIYLRRGRLKIGQIQIEFPKEPLTSMKDYEKPTIQAGEIPRSPSERQYALMQQYHSQGLAQAKISFWFSLVFASLGFLVIVVTLLTMDRSMSITQQGKTFIGLVSGTIIDAISALFFVQSNKARHLMTEFFDKLRIDRKFEESLQLCDNIQDPNVQNRLKVMLALNFAEVNLSDDIIRELVGNVSINEMNNAEKKI